MLINANFSRQTCTTQLLVSNSGVGECGTIQFNIMPYWCSLIGTLHRCDQKQLETKGK